MAARTRPATNRLVTMWCPHWAATATGLPLDQPIAVVRAHRVVAASQPAIDDGVLVGIRRREAQARCPAITIVEHDLERDARRFEPVARSVGTLVPRLEVTEPGLLTFAARGPSRYVGGDDALVNRVRELVVDGLAAGQAIVRLGLGVADGRFASGVAARHAEAVGRAIVVPTGGAATARYVARFPLRALHDVADVPLDLLDLLTRLGVGDVGQFARLPARDVLARFGTVAAFAHRLAAGADPRPTGAAEPPPELTVTRMFDDPVTQVQPLVFVAKQLAGELHDELSRRGLVAVRMAVEAETENDERSDRVWYRPEGLSPAMMVDRVRWQLDGWIRQPGGLSGGVTLLRLVPVETRADAGRQLGFWGGQTEADAWAARATARLVGLLGPDAITVIEERGGRGPGDAYALVSAAVADVGGRVASDPSLKAAVANPPPWPGRIPAPSPATVLADPRPCGVIDVLGLPVQVNGRGMISGAPAVIEIDGRHHALTGWAGPWLVEERWWDPGGGSRRARFQLVTDRGDAYLAALQRGEWQIEAIYS